MPEDDQPRQPASPRPPATGGPAAEIYGCRAVLLNRDDVARPRRAAVWTIAALGLFTITILVASLVGVNALLNSCGGPELIVLFAITATLALVRGLRPFRRGRLSLTADHLYFNFFLRPADQAIPLRDLVRLGRRKNRIHLTLRDGNGMFFGCSPLHGEDMHDQIVARLDELGIDHTSFEHKDGA